MISESYGKGVISSMDMRKILRKHIIPEEVKKYDYSYYPCGDYTPQILIITLHKDKGTLDAPNYDLKLSLDHAGRIIGIERLKSIKETGCSWFIKEYPKETDEKVEKALMPMVSNSYKGDYYSLIPEKEKNSSPIRENKKKTSEYWYSQFLTWLEGNNEDVSVGEMAIAIRGSKVDI